MTSRRIAVAESVRVAAEAAVQRLPPPRPTLAVPEVPAEARLRLRWQRLWQERRRASGESEAESEAALRDGSARALLAALDRQASAVLLAAADARAGAAWNLLEPLPGESATADVWIAELPLGTATALFGWCDWPAAGAAAAAPALRAAAAELERLGAGPARPLALDWFGGREEAPPRAAVLAEVLAARGAAASLRLYSPLLFSGGQLDAAALAAQARHAVGGATPVLCAPRLPREELAAAVERQGGSWAGPLRAGAELPVALAPAAPARLAATLLWLARRA